MDTSTKAVVEIIDFKRFPQKMKYGIIGMAFGQVTHGLTTNYFSTMIRPSQLDENGNPTISVGEASSAIRYTVASEISVALRFLQGCNWFDKCVNFITVNPEPLSEVHVEGWRDEWGTSARVDLAFYLEGVCEELEADGQIYTKEWYYAKVSTLYFMDVEIPDVAMTIGILLSQMWWKIGQEFAALRGHENVTSLDRANKAKKLRMKEQANAKNTIIQAYWRKALAEHGADVMRRDSNAAQAIFAIASEKRPRELQIRSTGKIIGPEAIRKRLITLRQQDKIG